MSKPFDPVAEGGVPVTETAGQFDPAAEGGVPVPTGPEVGVGEALARGAQAGAGYGWAPQLAGAGGWLASMLGATPGRAFNLDDAA